ncbi:hypothetical protein ACQP1G_21390 [Nocardia sp. CA-107356]|uniref:hypothetical protein n=1 Tax=Nocardia sp. CA-107356 TaxID=3239972 RepID=UPI003D8D19AE
MTTTSTRPPGEAGSDYDNLDDMRLDTAQSRELVGKSGECVFNWTTRDGYPMGVVVRYLYRDGAFWTTSVESRTRIRALRTRTRTAVVINRDGRSATFKGRSRLHRPGDPDWAAITGWFFPAFAGTDRHPNDPTARAVEHSLDTPHQVIVETPATLVVSFDFAKLTGASTTEQR